MSELTKSLGLCAFVCLAVACNSEEGGGGGVGGTGGLAGATGATAGIGTGGAGGTAGGCQVAQASCAQGQHCCTGLTCCAGMPVPAGQEYCSTTCPVSDRNLKTAIESVDEDRVLERLMSLPVSTWSYRAEGTDVRHMGPMAQDFQATFGLGASDRTILQVDADGVALASIQALYRRLEGLAAENQRLRQRLDQVASMCHEPNAQNGGQHE